MICLTQFANLNGLTTVILDLCCRGQKTDNLAEGQCKSKAVQLLSVSQPQSLVPACEQRECVQGTVLCWCSLLMSLSWMHSSPLYTALESSPPLTRICCVIFEVFLLYLWSQLLKLLLIFYFKRVIKGWRG